MIPGLWLPAWTLRPLGRRLRRAGFAVRFFSYPSVRADLRENAARLDRFLVMLDSPVIHLVAHSLGGAVVRTLFETCPDRKPGRIVTLASPHGGSAVARHLSRYAFWRRALGRGVAQLPAGAPPGWSGPAREVGTISGRRSLGIGRLLYRDLPRPNDGLLAVAETTLPAATDRMELTISHTGMLLSRVAARQVGAFLRTGRFIR